MFLTVRTVGICSLLQRELVLNASLQDRTESLLSKEGLCWTAGRCLCFSMMFEVLLCFLQRKKKRWLGYSWSWLWFREITLIPLSAKSKYKVIKVLTAGERNCSSLLSHSGVSVDQTFILITACYSWLQLRAAHNKGCVLCLPWWQG